MKKERIIAPKKGWVAEIAKLAGCSTVTVIHAIHYNSNGVKAEKCRQLYRKKYLPKSTNTQKTKQ
jgi:hypothetical protein